MFKAAAVRDGTTVALKCFHKGDDYSGAVEREKLILEKYNGVTKNIVMFHGVIEYRDYTFFVLELLHDNVRQIIYKNDRQGRMSHGCQISKLQIVFIKMNNLLSKGVNKEFQTFCCDQLIADRQLA